MTNLSTTNQELLEEISTFKRRTQELEKSEAERKRAESEQMFRSIVENSYAGIYTSDDNFRFSYVNDKLCEMSGYTREELLGMDLRQLIAQESLSIIEDRYVRRRKGEVVPSWYTFIGVHKNGERRFLETSATVVTNSSGEARTVGQILDINDRKQAEEALRESDNRLREITTQVPGMVYQFYARPNGTRGFYYVSDRSESVIGLKPNLEGYFERFSSMVIPEHRDGFIESIEKSVKESSEWKYEGMLQKPSGEIIWFSGNSAPSLRENEMVFNGIVQDITERKRAEEELLRTNTLLDSIIENIPDMIFLKDAKDLRFVRFNRAGEDLLGYSRDDLLGKSDYDFFPKDQADFFTEADRDVLRGKEALDISEEPLQSRNKGERTLHTKKVPILNANGEPAYLLGISKDITERKRAEEALRKSEQLFRGIIENATDIIYVVTLDGIFTYLSPTWMDFIGESAADAIGKPFALYTHPDDLLMVGEHLENIIKTGEPVKNAEFRGLHRDGSIRWLSTMTSGLRDEDGKVTGFMGIARDITEQKYMEEGRRKLEQQLAQAQKMEAIGALAGGIAHDFNNILAAIIGYTELYREQVRDRPKVYHGMEEVLKAAIRAKDLVRQILTFSRQTAQEKRPTEIVPIIKEVSKFIRASMPTTIEIKQKLNVTSDVIMADATQMHQVLMNLCTNAGHAMLEKGGVLEIRLEEVLIGREEQWRFPSLVGGRCLKLDVNDTGHGIKAENMEKIYEPYFTTKGKGEGTGLGLAVVHGIVKEHGGEIRAYSEVSRGTLFSVYLPLLEKWADAIPPVAGAALSGGSERILFIDDEDILANLGKEMLEILGYKVVAETDPAKAIELFRKEKDAFNLVITDKTMPHMTGFDVAQELREIREDIPVILCSGFQGKEDLEKQSTFDISCFIIKPIRMHILAETIRNVLDKRV